MVILYIIGVVISIILNLLVIIVVLARGRNVNHLDLLMLSLAVADTTRSAIGYPLEINALMRTEVINQTSCTIAGFATTFLALVSISHLVGISIERCIIIRFPWKSRNWFKNKWVSLYIIIPSWFYGLAWAVLPLLGWSSYEREQGAKYRCSIDLESETTNARSYAYSILGFCFVLPLLCIAASSSSTLHELRRMRRASVNIGMDRENADVRRKQEVRHTIMVFVLILSFLVSWSPYAACVLVMTIRGRVGESLLTFSAILAKTSTLWNPIIYAIFMKDFRVRCWLMLRGKPPPPTSVSVTEPHEPVAAVVNLGAVTSDTT